MVEMVKEMFQMSVDKLKMIENGQNPNVIDGRMEVAVATSRSQYQE